MGGASPTLSMRWPFVAARWPIFCRPVPARHDHPLLLQGGRKATASAALALTHPVLEQRRLTVRARLTPLPSLRAKPKRRLTRLRKGSIRHGSAPSTGKKHVCGLLSENAPRKTAVSSMAVRFRCLMANPAGSPTQPWSTLRHHTETALAFRQLLFRYCLRWCRMLLALRCRPFWPRGLFPTLLRPRPARCRHLPKTFGPRVQLRFRRLGRHWLPLRRHLLPH